MVQIQTKYIIGQIKFIIGCPTENILLSASEFRYYKRLILKGKNHEIDIYPPIGALAFSRFFS